MEYKHTLEELKELQALPLEDKIALSKLRITEWYEHYDGKVAVSFSGGKDSTVLLHLVRELYPEVPAVFVDTGLEFPEIKEHVKSYDNVTILRPKMSFKQVIEEHGWVYPSKRIAEWIRNARDGKEWAINVMDGYWYCSKEKSIAENKPMLTRNSKWKFLIDSPFKISKKCCDIMKKEPFKRYAKESQRSHYVGTMASESLQRKKAWQHTGCNAFKDKISKPLSFWKEQDVLRYIKDNNIPIAKVYGDIVEDKKGKLKTTGEERTGCMFCPIGSHLQKPNRFQRMKETHPKIWEYCMSEKGLNMKPFLEYIGVAYE